MSVNLQQNTAATRLPPPLGRGVAAVAALAFAAALALRVGTGLGRDLWEDEVIAATHAVQPLWQLPVAVARYDVHPPLFFMELHLWSLAGAGDLWLRLNAVLLSALAVFGLFVAGARLYGRPVGLVAAALLAVFPPAVWVSQEVRPYGLLSCLIIGAFYCLETACRSGLRTRRALVLAALCVAIEYTHAIGFLFVFALGIYGLGALAGAPGRPAAYRRWALVFGGAAIAAVPILATDLLHDANLGTASGLAGLADWLPRLLLPRGDSVALLGVAGAVSLAALLLGVAARATRPMALAFLVLPLAVCAAAQLTGRAVYKPNVIDTMLAPFLALVIARLLWALRPSRRAPALLACVALLAAGSVVYLANRVPTTGYLAASRLIEGRAQAGDVVYVPQQSMFWGMARYMVGPRWGSSLAVAGPPSPAWRAVYNRLGPTLVRTLRLEPSTHALPVAGGATLLVGNDSVAEAATLGRRVWLVTYDRVDLPSGFPPAAIGRLRPGPTVPIGFLKVVLYE